MSYMGTEPRLVTETLIPRSTDPSNPFEGMLYRADGTGARAIGVYEYKSGAWQTLNSSLAVSNTTNPVLDTSLTYSASFGTISENLIYANQEGKYLRLTGTFRVGTNTAATAQITLPTKWRIDTTVLPSTTNSVQVGMGYRPVTAAISNSVVIFYDGSDNTSLYMCSSGASNAFVKQTASSMFATGDRCAIDIRIPIIGFTASNPYTALNTSQFSTDSNALTFKSTAIVTGDAVGTFNTYTYASSSNTATISGSAPTQTTADMLVNGILVTGRAYNATSTTAAPCRFDIKVGTGLKGEEIFGYSTTGKTVGLSHQIKAANITLTTISGVEYSYDPTTGILTLNAGLDTSTLSTTRNVGTRTDTAAAAASGYFVVNAGTQASIQGQSLTTFTSAASGLVPASGGGTSNFLRADGTFAVPPGGGSTSFSSDTATFTFKSTAVTSADAVGTFNFYTKTASSNTLTLSALAPTQSTASMATDGVKMQAYPYTSATTLGTIGRLALVVGTGFKNISLVGYTATSKANTVDVTFSYAGFGGGANDSASGILKAYDQVNGILYLDCQTDPTAGSITVQRDIGVRITPTTVNGIQTCYVCIYLS